MSDHHHQNESQHHHHADEPQQALAFDQKLVKLLEHWIHHNAEHARNYRDWAQKAKGKNFSAAGFLIDDAAEMTLAISQKFEAAIKLIKSRT